MRGWCGCASCAPATSAGRPWPTWCCASWPSGSRWPTAPRWPNDWSSPVPAPAAGMPGSRWTPGPGTPWPGGATRTTAIWPGRSRRCGSTPSTWWCAWIGVTSRPWSVCPGAGPATTVTSSGWSCSGASTPVPEGESTSPTPTTATRPSSRPASTWSRRDAAGSPSTWPVGTEPGPDPGSPEAHEGLLFVGPHPLVEVLELVAAGPVVGQVDQLVGIVAVVVPLVVVVVEGAPHVEQLVPGWLAPQPGRRLASAHPVVAGVLGPTV